MISEDAVRAILKGWPLYSPDSVLFIKEIENILIVSYRENNSVTRTHDTNHFDLNIKRRTCYLVGLGIRKEFWGLGYGDALYKCIESIARKADCDIVKQTPSGWTATGKTRMQYLLERGYIKDEDGVEVWKKL